MLTESATHRFGSWPTSLSMPARDTGWSSTIATLNTPTSTWHLHSDWFASFAAGRREVAAPMTDRTAPGFTDGALFWWPAESPKSGQARTGLGVLPSG
ncbi:hypothetical protein GCM10009765_38840 [Fodinicola feengrottensis]|uniref:Uncharacterized protein n=1 Tax=Fodinicola feengrottensis TaxID=435914 RepID=A0ABN2HCU4_9ACTN